MEAKEIRTKLNEWSFPLGPFRPIQEVFNEMEMEARCMGMKAAPELARILVQLDAEGDPLGEDLYQFLQIYAKYYSHALEEALRKELRPTGPPALVEILGYTGGERAVRHIRQVLDLNQADDELLISVACALGELGGAEAVEMLQDLRGRQKLSKEVWHEIEMALVNISRFDEDSHLILGSILAHQRSNGVVVRQERDKNTPLFESELVHCHA